MRLIRRFLGLAVFLYLVLCLFIALFAAFQAAFEPQRLAVADVIVVLGAGMDADGTLHRSTILRVEKGVALYRAGTAPRLHFTGGRSVQNGPAAGNMMAELAMRLNVPKAAISSENASQSTLQNALFSLSMLGNPKRIILVTEGFHLPRSWASFHWATWQAGQSIDIALARSVAFRARSPNLRLPKITMVMRESLAWGFNLGRVALWQGAGLVGVARMDRDPWLQ